MIRVAIIKNNNLCYARDVPFHPSTRYPEYPFKQTSDYNTVYDSIRNLLNLLGMDQRHFGTKEWNPLGEIVKPGHTVLLKPNFVKHADSTDALDCIITHGSVIRAILDYVYIALKGEGRIIIGDAPIQGGDFKKIIEYNGISEIQAFYNDHARLNVEVTDFRSEASVKDKFGFITRDKLQGDESGSSAIDLKDESDLFAISHEFERFRVTNYDRKEMTRHHNKNKHEYLIANSILLSDVIINIPKLKTHRKVGMTCAMKNMVGINSSKDWLPHHRFGSTREGGDEYLYRSVRKRLSTRLCEKRDTSTRRHQAQLMTLVHALLDKTELVLSTKDPYREGSWYGNDTLPRAVVDLNKIALYADKKGEMKGTPQRKMMIIVDGVIAGEKEGPLEPSPKPCGLLVAGQNPVAVDLVCSKLIGFDYRKIQLFKYAMKAVKYEIFHGQPEDIIILSDICDRYDQLHEACGCDFIASKGWRGHIEYRPEAEATPSLAPGID